MSQLLRKDNPSQSSNSSHNNNSSSFIGSVGVGVAGSGNSNASSISSPDDFDDDGGAISAVTPSPATFKTNPASSSVAAASAASSILGNLSRLSAHHLSTTSSNYRKEYSSAMGGLSIPHHGLSAAFYGYHSHTSQSMAGESLTTTTTNSTSAHHFSSASSTNHPASNSANCTIEGSSTNAPTNNPQSSQFNSSKSSPFLLPAQLYKSLFANAVLHNPDRSHPFPRNLLFSYSDKSPNSPDFDSEEKHSIGDEVSWVRLFSSLLRVQSRCTRLLSTLFFSFVCGRNLWENEIICLFSLAECGM